MCNYFVCRRFFFKSGLSKNVGTSIDSYNLHIDSGWKSSIISNLDSLAQPHIVGQHSLTCPYR